MSSLADRYPDTRSSLRAKARSAPSDHGRRIQAEDTARDSAGNAFDGFGFVGTPQQLVEQIRPFIVLGVDYFMFDCGGFPKLTTLELPIIAMLPTLNN